MLHVERHTTLDSYGINDGYAALWQSDAGDYSIWNLDDTGAHVSGELITAVRDYETLFQADLDGDNLIFNDFGL